MTFKYGDRVATTRKLFHDLDPSATIPMGAEGTVTWAYSINGHEALKIQMDDASFGDKGLVSSVVFDGRWRLVTGLDIMLELVP
jgi:hypothetical protein